MRNLAEITTDQPEEDPDPVGTLLHVTRGLAQVCQSLQQIYKFPAHHIKVPVERAVKAAEAVEAKRREERHWN